MKLLKQEIKQYEDMVKKQIQNHSKNNWNKNYIDCQIMMADLALLKPNGKKLASDIIKKLYKNAMNNEYAIICVGDFFLTMGNYEYSREIYGKYAHRSQYLLSKLIYMYRILNNKGAAAQYENVVTRDFSLECLGNIEKSDNNFDKAKFLFNKIKNLNNKSFNNLFLILKAEGIENAIKYFYENINFFDNYTKCIFNNYIDATVNNNGSNTYMIQQMISYSSKSAIDHIQKHKSLSDEKPLHSIFSSDIDIIKFINETKSLIDKNIIKLYESTTVDVYVHDFKKIIGAVGNFLTSRVKIVTNLNTSDIITIYPVLSHYKTPILNLNEFEKKYKIK